MRAPAAMPGPRAPPGPPAHTPNVTHLSCGRPEKLLPVVATFLQFSPQEVSAISAGWSERGLGGGGGGGFLGALGEEWLFGSSRPTGARRGGIDERRAPGEGGAWNELKLAYRETARLKRLLLDAQAQTESAASACAGLRYQLALMVARLDELGADSSVPMAPPSVLVRGAAAPQPRSHSPPRARTAPPTGAAATPATPGRHASAIVPAHAQHPAAPHATRPAPRPAPRPASRPPPRPVAVAAPTQAQAAAELAAERAAEESAERALQLELEADEEARAALEDAVREARAAPKSAHAVQQLRAALRRMSERELDCDDGRIGAARALLGRLASEQRHQ